MSLQCSPDLLAGNNQCNLENFYVTVSYMLGILHSCHTRTYFVGTICPEKCPKILEIFCPEENFFLCLGLYANATKCCHLVSELETSAGTRLHQSPSSVCCTTGNGSMLMILLMIFRGDPWIISGLHSCLSGVSLN